MFYQNYVVCMTHYHLYIECGSIVDANSHFYRVAIGQSKPEQAVFRKLQAYAAQHGHFFEIATREHEEFFLQVINSLDIMAPPVQYVRGRDLLRSFRTSQALPLSPQSCHNGHQLRLTLNLDYRISSKNPTNR